MNRTEALESFGRLIAGVHKFCGTKNETEQDEMAEETEVSLEKVS